MDGNVICKTSAMALLCLGLVKPSTIIVGVIIGRESQSYRMGDGAHRFGGGQMQSAGLISFFFFGLALRCNRGTETIRW